VIYHVPAHLIEDIWPAIEGHVSRACVYHPFMGASDVRTLLDNGLAELFIATDPKGVMGFGVLEVVEYPRCRVANILGAGGKHGFLAVSINELLPFMIAHGKTRGATVVTLSGRPGWLRALRHLGGRSQRFITWWADIDEQGRRTVADIHERTVEASATVPH
jgi:hypothetical protein